MTINLPSFSTSSAESQARLVVKMLSQRPPVLRRLTTSVVPNEIAGYYDSEYGVVELYMASQDGTYWMRIAS